MAIPTLMLFFISENDINKVCDMASNSDSNENDRTMVGQA